MSVRKFRKKPIVIDAICWDETQETYDELVYWTKSEEFPVGCVMWSPEGLKVFDKLHQTWIKVYVNQWIIKGTRNEFYPHAAENFFDAYEEVLSE